MLAIAVKVQIHRLLAVPTPESYGHLVVSGLYRYDSHSLAPVFPNQYVSGRK